MGWSWGTAIMGVYTAQHNDKVNRLVLYAPLWIFSTRPIIGGDGPLGAYRTVTKESAKARWLSGVAEDRRRRRQESRSDPARLVRAMGRRDLGD